jgi:hypothetical protein
VSDRRGQRPEGPDGGEPAEIIDARATERPLEKGRPAPDDLPVVARLVVEIRSDGKRTVARGAMEDAVSGQSVAIEARGDSPLELAFGLARTLFQLPRLGRATVRGLLAARRKP